MENSSEETEWLDTTDLKEQCGERRASEIPLSLKKLVLQKNGTLSKVNKKLLFFKYFYFVFYSAVGTTFPFLSRYFRQIGLSSGQVQTLSGVRPAVHLVFGPLWGFVGDRFISKKMIIQFALSIWLVGTISLAFLEPTGQICQVIVINETSTKVINYTEMKTGFFRRKRSILETIEIPLPFISIESLPSGHVGGITSSESSKGFGSGSGDPDDSPVSGSGTLGSGEEDLVISKLDQTRKHGSSIEVVSLPTKPEDNINGPRIITRNVLRDNPVKLYTIFLTTLVLIGAVELFACPVLVLLDSVLISRQHEENFSYGHQRLFGSLGYMLLFFVVGALLEKSTRPVCGDLFHDYIICFCFFCFMTVLTLVVTVKFDIPHRPPDVEPIQRIKSIFYDRHHGTLLASVCCTGFNHYLLSHYFNSFLADTSINYSTTAVINFFRFTGEPAAFFLSSIILNRAGKINVMFGIPVVTAFNLLCSSFVTSPWHLVPLGFIDGFTYGISWVAYATYLVNSAPADCTATIQGVVQSAYWGLGSGLGLLIGSNLMGLIGPGAALRFFAVLSLVNAAIFTIGLRGFYFSETNYYTSLMRCLNRNGGAKCEVVLPGKPVVSRGDCVLPVTGVDVQRTGKPVSGGGKKEKKKLKNRSDESDSDSGHF